MGEKAKASPKGKERGGKPQSKQRTGKRPPSADDEGRTGHSAKGRASCSADGGPDGTITYTGIKMVKAQGRTYLQGAQDGKWRLLVEISERRSANHRELVKDIAAWCAENSGFTKDVLTANTPKTARHPKHDITQRANLGSAKEQVLAQREHRLKG